MGEAAKATAAGQEIEFRGRTYRMADFNVTMIGLLEARLQRRSVEAIERMRPSLPPAEFEEWRRATILLIGSAQMSYGSEALTKFSFTPEGMQYGCFLQMSACPENGPLTEEFVAEMWEECKDKLATLAAVTGAVDPTKARPVDAAGKPSA